VTLNDIPLAAVYRKLEGGRMDNINRFATKTSFALLRAEYGVVLGVCVVAFFAHIGEIRWIPAVLLFAYIDVVGYLPGLVAHLRAKNHQISRIYYVLYNTMHSFITQSIVVGLWICIFGFEWALLVVPIHLCGDRAIFGNFMKSFSVPFEPKPLPAFAEFERRLTVAAGERREALPGSDKPVTARISSRPRRAASRLLRRPTCPEPAEEARSSSVLHDSRFGRQEQEIGI
jgi:hypothetical protein